MRRLHLLLAWRASLLLQQALDDRDVLLKHRPGPRLAHPVPRRGRVRQRLGDRVTRVPELPRDLTLVQTLDLMHPSYRFVVVQFKHLPGSAAGIKSRQLLPKVGGSLLRACSLAVSPTHDESLAKWIGCLSLYYHSSNSQNMGDRHSWWHNISGLDI